MAGRTVTLVLDGGEKFQRYVQPDDEEAFLEDVCKNFVATNSPAMLLEKHVHAKTAEKNPKGKGKRSST